MMKKVKKSSMGSFLAVSAISVLLLAGCSTSPKQNTQLACNDSFNQSLSAAMGDARYRVAEGCSGNYFGIFSQLLEIGQGDPKPENKQMFSQFLEWSADEGIISKRQARETYTKYFGTKFVSALSDYNTCAAFCPIQDDLLSQMKDELVAKDLGILKVSGDVDGYNRANTLHDELELVITATCEACSAEKQQVAGY